jgi:type IV pilus assembly protein PilY1
MNMGGSRIQVTDAALPGGTQTFYSSYAAFDVTEASKTPTLLWEKDFGGILGYTTSAPCVFKVKDKWFLAIGSGPTAYDAVSTQKGRVIIVDVATGALLRTFETDETAAFMNTPVALDKNLNFSVAAIYAGSTYRVGTGPWQGRAYKIAIPQLNGSGVYSPSCKDCYDDNPANWVWTKILDMPAPFTAPFALSIDQKDNVWIFMGSGRFHASDDKTSGTQNYIMGMKDPFYNRRGIAESKTTGLPACYNKYDVTCPLTAADLFNATPYAIKADGTVDVKAGFTETLGLDGKTFDDMMTLGVKKKGTGTDPLEIYQGWYRELLVPPASCPCICVDLACDVDQSCMTNPACPSPCNRESCTASERNLNKPVAFGGLALFPTFTPIADPCMSGGTSNLYGLYFESGTAYKKAAFLQADNTAVIQDVIGLGFGLASAPAIHAAKEAGQSGTAYMQMSTGQIVEIPIDPIFNIKSGIQFWREGR